LGLRSRRLALQRSAGERIETERILSTARVVLALTSVLAFQFNSSRFQNPSLIEALLLLYCAHSLALMATLWFRTKSKFRHSGLVHATDLLWPTVISLITNGPSSPFFLYFVFAILGAAFRWGLRESLLTVVGALAAMTGDAKILTLGPMARLFESHFDANLFVVRTVYMVILAFLVGSLAESEKQRRAEALSIAQISSEVRVDVGLKGTLQAVLHQVLSLFGARELLLVAGDPENLRANLWRVERLEPGDVVFSWGHLDAKEWPLYAFDLPSPPAAAAWRRNHDRSAILLDREGNHVRGARSLLPTGFPARHSFESLLSIAIPAMPDISARIFLFDPKLGGRTEEQLRFLQSLTHQISPAVHNVYILRRLRSRAASVERGRVARELHDGVVQTLHAIAFRLYALRTNSTLASPECAQELLEIQELVQAETTSLRTLIHQLKPVDFDPRHLVDFLGGVIDRYRYETGIQAKFVCDVAEVSLRPQACREIAGIVQEALANVLKHSGAENVLVRLSAEKGHWILSIEDDGRGFAFSGKLTQAELEKIRGGPLVIKERVRSLGGELVIESKPSQGARLVITFPQMSMSNTA
ncbi:MAG TPA: histidine kinase, partial [Candidatus Binatia bacterium]|nr:histidine kinase [Candidatus Binatia bacterium]